ncbi:CRISPR-associated endonuclease Cas2, partial [Accumulibacter sp.]|uniref:CRISPR-associated endonuclease Cas2 n=1 Tax=Accumulibacter sp. TaxID=2053492 RepID=UPI0025C5B79B
SRPLACTGSLHRRQNHRSQTQDAAAHGPGPSWSGCRNGLTEEFRFKVGGQKSFFECWLTPAELCAVRSTLADLLDPAEDRTHIFQLDPRMTRDLLGRATQPATDVFLIV